MNERVWTGLKAHVERTTLFLPLRPAQKAQVQEELLAHLVAVYEEELARLKDDEAALNGATSRFGDPEALGEEIRDTVPFSEWLWFALGFTKENIMWRWLVLLGFVAVAVGLGFVFPAVAQLRGLAEVTAATVPLLVFGIVVTLGGFGSLAYGAERFRTRHS